MVKEAEWWMKEIIEEVKAELLDEWKGKRKFCHCQRAERIENRRKQLQWGEIQENRRGDAKKNKYKYENKNTKIQIWKQKYKNGNQRVGGEGVVMQIVASKWKIPRKCEGKRTLLWSQKNIAGIAWHCDMGWHCGTVRGGAWKCERRRT